MTIRQTYVDCHGGTNCVQTLIVVVGPAKSVSKPSGQRILRANLQRIPIHFNFVFKAGRLCLGFNPVPPPIKLKNQPPALILQKLISDFKYFQNNGTSNYCNIFFKTTFERNILVLKGFWGTLLSKHYLSNNIFFDVVQYKRFFKS
jgi:hypothetical protein